VAVNPLVGVATQAAGTNRDTLVSAAPARTFPR